MKLPTAQIWVPDQEEALEFYTQKLGMEVRFDVTVRGARQLPLADRGPPGQHDVAIVLMAIPGPPDDGRRDRRAVKDNEAKGVAGTVFLTTDDSLGGLQAAEGRRRRVHRGSGGTALRDRLRIP